MYRPIHMFDKLSSFRAMITILMTQHMSVSPWSRNNLLNDLVFMQFHSVIYTQPCLRLIINSCRFIVTAVLDLSDDFGNVKNIHRHRRRRASDFLKERERLILVRVQSEFTKQLNWYQLARGLGWDTVSINATQSHSGEHLVNKRLYAILKYV